VNKPLFWWLALLDVVGLPCATMWIIWHEPPRVSYAWIALPLWLVGSIVIQRDTPKSLGWRADNLWPASRRASYLLGPMALALIVIGYSFGNRLPEAPGAFAPHHFWNYFAFCLLQQVTLNSFLSNRLYFLTHRVWPAAFIAAAIFATFHWPNPVLIPATFFVGAVMSWLFLRERNVLPLAVWHMALGILLGWALPLAWHHGLRVGPGYNTFPH
jgi:CAAX prenyl protease-like protein